VKKDDLSNADIALFALYKLGGVTKKIHTEYVAWEAFQLAPERFSWRLPEFRERGFPDKTPVRHALEQTKKKAYGSLLKGRAGGDAGGKESEGWIFTPKGAEWIKQNELRIAQALKLESPPVLPREANRFLRKVTKDISYICFQKDGDLGRVSPYMFTDMLGCTPDASKEIISKKFGRLLSAATLVGDETIIEFLNKCRQQFSFLTDKERSNEEVK